MSTVYRSRVVGPLAAHADGFREELARLGYTPGSTEIQLWWVGQISRWLAEEKMNVAGLDERAVTQFLEVVETGRARTPTVRTFAALLGWLRHQGLVPAASPPPMSPVDELLARYERWLVDERGLMARTIARYVGTARRFLSLRISPTNALGVDGLTGKEVTEFLLAEAASGLSIGGVKGRVAELRALLRYLHVEGMIPNALAVAVPPVGGWRDAGLPRTLAASDVRAMLEGCDRATLTGLRDFAILTVLARLGLRASEVAGLHLEDLDWRAGEIAVRGKGRRNERLPLPTDVGEALAAYLTEGRPQAECRNVFLTRQAPWRPLHPNTIGRAVWFACQRAGVTPVRSHRLRHALATEMLRQGVALPDIGQVLRHRDLATTAVYAKVDLASLCQVARPWPGTVR